MRAPSALSQACSAASAISKMDTAARACPVRYAPAACRVSCQIATIPSRAKIDKAIFLERVRERVIAQLRPPCFGVAIDLVSRGSQAMNAMPVHIALPGHKLIDREVVTLARLVDRKPATAHGLD